MHRKYIIYRILNLINGKYYVGKTVNSLLKRWQQHVSKSKKPKDRDHNYIHRSIAKYGKQNFEIKQIDTAFGYDHSVFLEGFYARYYNSFDKKYGYNLAAIGDTKDGFGYGERDNGHMAIIGQNRPTKRKYAKYKGVYKAGRSFCTRVVHSYKVYSKCFET